jgi:cytochrome c-type biogenesis protein CcsB
VTSLAWARFSNDTFNVAMFAYLPAMVASFAYMAYRRRTLLLVSRVAVVAGLSAHLASIVTRGLAAGHVPWGTMFEYSSLLAFLVVLGAIVLVEGVYKVRTITGFAIAFSILTMAIAYNTRINTPAGPLVPALDSYWIKIHVVAAILGSSLFALGGGVLTILYLVKDGRERREAAGLAAESPPPIMGASLDLSDPPHFAPGADEAVGTFTDSPRRRGILPPSAVLDRMAYRTIAFAFPIWTFAVIAGAIWAQQSWGRYWGWDPKETWSFITWVIYAGYLHARATSGWRGRGAAAIAMVGFASLLVTYYVVNLWIVGLHTYAGTG